MHFTVITAQQFQQLQNAGGGVLIDVRTPVEYRSLHIAGAVNLPLDQLTAQQLAEQDSAEIYLICKGGKRAIAAAEKVAADFLEKTDNGKLLVVDGGTEACAQLGLPCNQGKQHMSLERQVRVAAGSLVLLGVILGFTVHSGFFGLSGFIGAGLVFAGITDTCAMGMLLAKMPWNKV